MSKIFKYLNRCINFMPEFQSDQILIVIFVLRTKDI